MQQVYFSECSTCVYFAVYLSQRKDLLRLVLTEKMGFKFPRRQFIYAFAQGGKPDVLFTVNQRMADLLSLKERFFVMVESYRVNHVAAVPGIGKQYMVITGIIVFGRNF